VYYDNTLFHSTHTASVSAPTCPSSTRVHTSSPPCYLCFSCFFCFFCFFRSGPFPPFRFLSAPWPYLPTNPFQLQLTSYHREQFSTLYSVCASASCPNSWQAIHVHMYLFEGITTLLAPLVCIGIVLSWFNQRRFPSPLAKS
jgi:hypothetical protein